MALAVESQMAEKEQKATSIRIALDAVESAKIAAAYKGMTVMDYVTQLVRESAARDIEEGHRLRSNPGTKRKG